jgi:hypothetical protein
MIASLIISNRDFAPDNRKARRPRLALGELSTNWILVLITRVDSRRLMRRTQNRGTWYYDPAHQGTERERRG